MTDAEFARALTPQLAAWTAEGLISPEQAGQLRARHPLPGPSARGTPWATTLAVVGAVLLGLGVITFVAANWGAIPDALKLGLLVVSMLAAYAGGYALRDRPGGRPGLGLSLYLLGALLYAATLFFVAQGLQLGTPGWLLLFL